MYSSMLGLPMMYITHISSKSSVFETIRVNKSMNTSPILVSIHTCFERKYLCMCEYWVAYVREYIPVPYLGCACILGP